MFEVHATIGSIVRQKACERKKHAERMNEIEEDSVRKLYKFVTSQDYV